MRHRQGSTLIKLAAFGLLVVAGKTFGQEPEEFSRELEHLGPFLVKWVGEFQGGEERPRVHRSWNPALGGQAIREIRTVPSFGFEAESLFFFDREVGTLLTQLFNLVEGEWEPSHVILYTPVGGE